MRPQNEVLVGKSKQTHKEEVTGGFMWSPKQNANGARNQFYENMQLVKPGDVIFLLPWLHTKYRHLISNHESKSKPESLEERVKIGIKRDGM